MGPGDSSAIESSSFGMDGRRVSRLLGAALAGGVSALCTQVDDTVSCCDESCRVSECRLSTVDPVTTTCPLAAMYATHQVRSPNREIHTRCAVGRIEMAGCLFMRHKRRGFHPRGRKGGAVGRKTGPGGPADVVSGSTLSCLNRRVSRVSDSFASGKEAAKQLGRPRGIDETAESCSLFETRGRNRA